MFLHREEELAVLRRAAEKSRTQNAGALVYGRRRVGKSTLVRKALEDFDGAYIEYECQEALFSTNLRNLAECVAEALGSSSFAYVSDINILLAEIRKTGRRIALFIDEYQFFREGYKEGVLDSVFQNLIDSPDGRVFLVLCGSHITVMEKLLEKDNPISGRFEASVFLQPFSYLEAACFYPEKSVPAKLAFHAIFGAMPFVLAKVDPEESLEENIIRLLLSSGEGVRSVIEDTLLKEMKKISMAQSVLDCIGNGRKKNCEIASSLNESEQTTSASANRLISMGLLKKTYPINDPENEKKTFLEISDNLLRFYYSLVFRRRSELGRLGPRAFFSARIEPVVGTFVASRFEYVVEEFFKLSLLAAPDLDILDYGRYWYGLPKEKRNGEFDNVLKTSKGYLVIESKYLSSPMGRNLMEEERAKMEAIPNLGKVTMGFASASGFVSRPTDCLTITGDDLYDREGIAQGRVFEGWVGRRIRAPKPWDE